MRRAFLLAIVLPAVALGCCRVSRSVPGGHLTDHGTVVFQAQGTAMVVKPGDRLAVEEARVAAAAIARVNLLAKVRGASVASKATVDGLIFEGHSVTVEVEGKVSGVVIHFVEEPSDGDPVAVTALVELELDVRDLHRLRKYVK